MAYYRIDFGGDEDLERRYAEALQRAMDYTKQVKEGKIVIAEPVAWMGIRRHGETRVSVEKLANDDIPLFTHPVKELKQIKGVNYYVDKPTVKELTDAEINDAWKQSHEDGIAMQQGFTTQQHYFAHLILRKASEK